ncbi:MAG: TatD family hydrolase [Bacteroidales bacterium]|nr:TatD family hydrolase [Bacteroidales bacterium]
MNFTDTHTHLYVEEFDDDRNQVIQQAVNNGVTKMLLPNIDGASLEAMHNLVSAFPENCFPMMGLHPTSVNEDFEKELTLVESELKKNSLYIGVGEIGTDLYWDETYREEQTEAFRRQLQLAKKYRLPVSIHTRNSFALTLKLVQEELTDDLKGVFHCFTGTESEAKMIMDTGFKMGIGGIVTFKNSGLDKVVAQLPLDQLVLETDAPYLTPVPYRGKRNQSAYLIYVAEKLATVQNKSLEEVAETTTNTVNQLFFNRN